MNYDRIMVRYGELSTKGKNKKDFVNKLASNIKHALKNYTNLEYIVRLDHTYIILNGSDVEPILERLKDVSGIHSMSMVLKVESEIETIKSPKKVKPLAPILSDKAPLIGATITIAIGTHISINPDIKEESFKVSCK